MAVTLIPTWRTVCFQSGTVIVQNDANPEGAHFYIHTMNDPDEATNDRRRLEIAKELENCCNGLIPKPDWLKGPYVRNDNECIFAINGARISAVGPFRDPSRTLNWKQLDVDDHFRERLIDQLLGFSASNTTSKESP